MHFILGAFAAGLFFTQPTMDAGLFSQPDPPPSIVANLFSAIVIMAVLTTLMTPIALRFIITRET
jgi:hypothetical protein